MVSDFYTDLVEKIESGMSFSQEQLNTLSNEDVEEDDVRALSRSFNLIETYFSAIDRNLQDFYDAIGESDEYEQSPFDLFEGLTEQYFGLKDQFADIIEEVRRSHMQQQAQGMGGMGGLGGDDGPIDLGGPGGPDPSGGQGPPI